MQLTPEGDRSFTFYRKPGADVMLAPAEVDRALLRDGGYELLDDAVRFLPFWARGVRFFTILGPNGEKVEFSQKL